MKYEVEDENHKIVNIIEAENIREAADSIEDTDVFDFFFEGREAEVAYNGTYKISRSIENQ